MKTFWVDMDDCVAGFTQRFIELTGYEPHLYEKLFGTEAFWEIINTTEDFFATLPKTVYCDLFLSFIEKHFTEDNGYRIAFLTSVPEEQPHAEMFKDQKQFWVRQILHRPYPVVFSNGANDKQTFIKCGDVLLDDISSTCSLVNQKEGYGIWVDTKAYMNTYINLMLLADMLGLMETEEVV